MRVLLWVRAPEEGRAHACSVVFILFKAYAVPFHAGQKKWLMVEEQKPRRERRPLPPPPPDIAAGELPTGKNADAFNESMYQHWDQHSLVPCPFCKPFTHLEYDI